MPTARPSNPDHSINEVAFVLNFSQPLSENNLLSLKQLEDQLKDTLPKMDLQEGAGIQIMPDGKMVPQKSKLLSLAFRHFNNKDEFDLALRAEGNLIAVNCLDYEDGWKQIWPKVHDFLKAAASKLISTENPIDSLALQYIDRFIYEGQIESYKTSTIFDTDSVYLNKKVSNTGPFWHIHQGWFEIKKDLSSRILNRLNITATLADKEHHTTIDHSGTIQFKKKIVNYKTLFDESINGSIAIDYYFNLLHDENKHILQNLLNEDRIADIKLTQNL